MTITGPGANLLTVRRDPGAGTPQMRVFKVDDGSATTVITVTITGMTISGGSTTGVAAGVSGSGVVGDGAALLLFNDTVTLDGVVITGNTSGSEGGGLAVASPSGAGVTTGGGGFLTVRNSTISGNTANGLPTTPTSGFGGAGGGIYFANTGSLDLENSTISGNVSTNGTTGGVYFYGTVGAGGLTIRNSTISGNTAKGQGGGAGSDGGLYLGYLGASGTALIQNCTIANNTVTGGTGGGIGHFGSGTVSLVSTVVANNSATGSPDVSGAVTASFSLIRDQSGATITDAGNNLAAGTNPLFAATGLTNNGGPTQTIALQATSPLIDKGSNPAGLTTDQRGTGFARVVGPAADIGAFEVQPAQASVQSTVVNGGQANLTQRSVVTNLTVTFDRRVAFVGAQTAAFQLTRTGPTGPTGNVTLNVDLTGSTATQTIAKLTFSGPLTEGPNSLIDGDYTLTVFSAQVQGGIQGGDNLTNLFRYYGDVNGDRTVNGLDLALFRSAFGTSLGNPNYVDYLDQNGDGVINGLDLAVFRTHFGTTLP